MNIFNKDLKVNCNWKKCWDVTFSHFSSIFTNSMNMDKPHYSSGLGNLCHTFPF